MKLIESGRDNAKCLMDRDAELLNTLKSSAEPILHLYDWAKPSAARHRFALMPRTLRILSSNVLLPYDEPLNTARLPG